MLIAMGDSHEKDRRIPAIVSLQPIGEDDIKQEFQIISNIYFMRSRVTPQGLWRGCYRG